MVVGVLASEMSQLYPDFFLDTRKAWFNSSKGMHGNFEAQCPRVSSAVPIVEIRLIEIRVCAFEQFRHFPPPLMSEQLHKSCHNFAHRLWKSCFRHDSSLPFLRAG